MKLEIKWLKWCEVQNNGQQINLEEKKNRGYYTECKDWCEKNGYKLIRDTTK